MPQLLIDYQQVIEAIRAEFPTITIAIGGRAFDNTENVWKDWPVDIRTTDAGELMQMTYTLNKYLNWADENIQAPYQDGYDQVELLNNRLLNSERALMKKTRRLEKLLEDMRQANSTVSMLERACAQDTGTIKRVLSGLRGEGFVVEMDDFGTGESSLSTLADLPVDVLKLDRGFIKEGLTDKRRLEVLRCVIQLARGLDLRIIAEGVENLEQQNALTSMDCHYAQGYFYYKPQPAEEFANFA